MRPSLQFSVLCDDAAKTSDGKPVFWGAFEAIRSAEFPAVHARMFIVNRWTAGVGNHTEHTRIISPDGSDPIAVTPATSFSLADRSSAHTVTARIDGLPLTRAGTYWIQVYADDELALEYPLNVMKAKA